MSAVHPSVSVDAKGWTAFVEDHPDDNFVMYPLAGFRTAIEFDFRRMPWETRHVEPRDRRLVGGVWSVAAIRP